MMGWIFWQGVHSPVCNDGDFIIAGHHLWSVLCLLYSLSQSFLRILPPRPGLGTPSISFFLNSLGPPSLSRLSQSSATFIPPAHLRRLLFNHSFLSRPFFYSRFPVPLSPSILIALFPSSRMLSSVFPLRHTFICLLPCLPATLILPYLHLSLALLLPLLKYSVLKRWYISWTHRWRGIMKRM